MIFLSSCKVAELFIHLEIMLFQSVLNRNVAHNWQYAVSHRIEMTVWMSEETFTTNYPLDVDQKFYKLFQIKT